MFLQNEAKRPRLPHDNMEMGYLFDLNEDVVLDAFRFRLRQQEQVHQPRRRNAQLPSEGGERMWRVPHQNMDVRNILLCKEMDFDYGFKRSVASERSQRQAASKCSS
ncbi:hypothetical protein JG687_00010459 [Phytophthora cactorum]|uniref:Uncharacterized protein n=1 Tax=Phytophthora cactorum TaxID=29920 RepID=A0A329T136_9STRA|nr:hypothetical protein GQ600_16832 [Phytophthora cactorum]KAG2771402.1 hypothetical protein Pcac1_g17451 [Phytophthora cactorum]KAG2809074.1 hypothetical protein PC112_g16667 [Phytophthora cactorum]KAG2812170.1 hypothetical protein PC111_g14920 [Phytophthora cactorum]KAG2850488.1 hypothetical protein PC113_g16737 [Phytophthora cactorum]